MPRVSETLRWGLLGTAHINRRVIPAMRAARRSAVLAVASRNAIRAEAYARDWNIPSAHPSYDSLLRDGAVDAVYIPLPNSLHVEWTLRALDAGKHVLCEKPLALNPEDVDRVAAVARARERIAVEAFMYRHEPLIARVVQLIHAGVIGPLRSISAGFTFAQNRNPDIRLDPTLGGGSLWDIGCYAVSAVVTVAGAIPNEAFGFATSAPSGVDESFTGLLRFPGDLTAAIHSSFRASYRTWLEIGGADGMMRVANLFKPGRREQIEVWRGDEVERIEVEGSSLLFVRQIEDVIAAALDGRAPALTLQDSRHIAASLAALHRSADLGRPVQL